MGATSIVVFVGLRRSGLSAEADVKRTVARMVERSFMFPNVSFEKSEPML